VALVQPRQVEDSTEYVATLKALQSTSVRPQVEGYIVRISVKSGQRVQQGTPLLEIDQARQQATVATQEASVSAREADLAYARQQYQRLEDLYGQRVVSKAELDQAQTAVKTAESALASALAQVSEQRVQLRYYRVDAPASGIIGDVPVRVGDRVNSDTELTTIDGNDQLEVLLPIPSERSPDLRLGLALQLLSATNEVITQTSVTFISPRVDVGTQSVLVKGVVKNPGGQLRSQQFVRTRVIWGTSEGITIPVLAVTRISGQPFVFVAEDQKGQQVARQRTVRLGPIVGNDYAVLEGVKAGERIVVSGVQKLADGVPITPTAQAS
jgi:RND family efflux transporter MFP subunit